MCLMRIRGIRGCLPLVVVFIGHVAARGQMYTATDLGTLPGYRHSRALGISNVGHIVGISTNDLRLGPHRAFLWRNGLMIDLGTLGGAGAVANGVSDDGMVAGWSDTQVAPADSAHAFLWTKAKMNDLRTLGGVSSWAEFVLAGRQVVGGARLLDGSYHGSLWDKGGIEDLGVLPGHCCSAARAMDASGRIVGFSSTEFAQARAVVWFWEQIRPPRVRDLGALPGGCCSEAFDINDGGRVVGFSWTTDRRGYVAVAWDLNEDTPSPRNLGSLIEGGNSQGYAVNASNLAVGMSWTASVHPGKPHACMWYEAGICDLNDIVRNRTAWVMQDAQDINDSGDIVGSAVDPETGTVHAVLATRVQGKPWDFDGDTDIDLDDYASLASAWSGPNGSSDSADAGPSVCVGAVAGDSDGDVDLWDFANFQRAFTAVP
jgi:probable HAF family extracellular repeat protein